MMRVLGVAFLALAGCASAGPRLAPAAASNAAALDRAVEAFYRAEKPAEMRAAVEEAQKAGPDTAAYHEIAAELAELDNRREDQVRHLSAALADASDPAALLHLHHLGEQDLLSEKQKDGVSDLLEQLWRGHPDARVRALAAYLWIRTAWERGNSDAPSEAAGALFGVLPLQLVGGWDNEQGKGFETVLPPEEGVDPAARYRGAVVDIGWRKARTTPWGILAIGTQTVPRRAAVAYGASGVEVPAAGRYEVRLSTSEPVKLWVDGALVLSVSEVKDFSFDGFVIPVELSAGPHQVLVKSAQDHGGYLLLVRVTGPEGRAVPGLSPLAMGRTSFVPATAPPSLSKLLAADLQGLPEGSARRSFHEVFWTTEVVAGREAVHRAEEVAAAYPRSLAARAHLASALWDEGERGRAADLVSELDRSAGTELPLLAIRQGRMWRQQGLSRKARTELEAVVKAHPDRPDAYGELAQVYKNDGWQEDRCKLLRRAVALWPGDDEAREQLGGCSELGLSDEWDAIQKTLLSERPGSESRIEGRVNTLVARGRIDEALDLARELERNRPDSSWAPGQVGVLLRRLGRLEEAEAAFRRALALDPDNAGDLSLLASLAYVRDDTTAAMTLWKEALDRSPADQQLANRLTELVPAASGDWAADVPDGEAIDRAVGLARSATPLPGADILVALDDEVRSVNADGSVSSVTTEVRRAATQTGVDKILQLNLGSGSHRVIAAYALDQDGKRVEPSTVEKSRILFRGLQVGSIVVTQVRTDDSPRSILESSVEGVWWFEAYGSQVLDARLVLWRAAAVTLREKIRGVVHVSREEQTIAGKIRVAYSAHQTPPAVPEEATPPGWDVLTNIHYSTLPDWETFTRWEHALLQDALRPSTEVAALAHSLAPRDAPVGERLERIQSFLMQQIRYQQDYENPIAGWKPHPTSMVLERKYGDCKDKANLFIMLARELGIDARFALVRTRTMGEVDRDVPGLQFNHAIVQIPAQPGFPVARFFDPTADALDLASVPGTDQGTLSLVYDDASGKNDWVPIDFQDPHTEGMDLSLKVTLKPDGSARGQLTYSSRGDQASAWRRGSRNPESFLQSLKTLIPRVVNGAVVVGTPTMVGDDLHKAAVMEMALEVPHLARPEDRGLRLAGNLVRLPVGTPSLPSRRFPLQMGVPVAMRVMVEVTPPEGWVVRSIPPDKDIEDACIHLHRQASLSHNVLTWQLELVQRCERVAPGAYGDFRSFVAGAVQTMDDPAFLAPRR